MSASLVGSEMCIRDSPCGCAAAPSQAAPSAPYRAGRTAPSSVGCPVARTPRPCGGAPRELPGRRARSTPGASRSSPRRSP
eukprot:1427425-Alexandrium_andersonii.AAC.1